MIALIDCNNFYCSCERVFNPEVLKSPVIVLSNNDGCAISRSEEAKALGIGMAQPGFLYRKLQEDGSLKVFSSNYTLYADMSRRVVQVISEFFPLVEVYSIDEVFADCSGLYGQDLADLAFKVKSTVYKATGIPVTIGMAPTKTLAKLANRMAKKAEHLNGVNIVEGNNNEKLLSAVMVNDIWGIGPQHAVFLKTCGITTALDFSKASQQWVRKNLSVTGLRTQMELNGQPCISLTPAQPKKKNIRTSRSFGERVFTKAGLSMAIAKFTASCAEKLRREQSAARFLTVFIQTNPHRPNDPQYFESITLSLPAASSNTTDLMRQSMKGLDYIFRPGYGFQKAGVEVSGLVPEAQVQLNLFEQSSKNRGKLLETIDQTNKAFGKDTIRFAVQDYSKKWHLKRDHLSASFTSKIDQLPKVNAR